MRCGLLLCALSQIRNEDSSAMSNLRVKVEYFPPTFANQFHLVNTGQYLSSVPGSDVNIKNVWSTYNGSGIVVDICDDGLQISHNEIAPRARVDLRQALCLCCGTSSTMLC
jgi:hypothetical protein